MSLYPLKFEPIYLPKVWGGRYLEQLGRALPGDNDHAIGESWELADLASTSPTGAGGQAVQSVVANGELAGQTLGQLIETYNSKLTGELAMTGDHAFPLLIKYLDAHQNLSLQVHPSPRYAAEHPEANLKTEGWYVIDARPGAVIYKGFKPGVDEGQVRRAIADDSIVDLLNVIPVKPGEFHFLPSGTCHALGRGVLVAEIQTPSDTTFRLYDWGRTDRELHIDEALACIDFDVSESLAPHMSDEFHCEHFSLHAFQMEPGQTLDRPADGLAVWLVLQGAGELRADGELAPVSFKTGQTLLLPSDMPYGHATFSRETTLLQITGG